MENRKLKSYTKDEFNIYRCIYVYKMYICIQVNIIHINL